MDRIDIYHHGHRHHIHYDKRINLSEKLDFKKNIINWYGAEPARIEPLKYGNVIADLHEGGSCNASMMHISAHCHGTHTECIGHIILDKYEVTDLDIDFLIPSTLIRVDLEKESDTKDRYNSSKKDEDFIISRGSIESKINESNRSYLEALIIVTDSNFCISEGVIPPYFSQEAMEFIVELGVKHLVVDLPSIDRIEDRGYLDNHKTFWGVEGNFSRENSRIDASITEMIKVPSHVLEGKYFLSIQMPNISGDALPSKPILFPFSLR